MDELRGANALLTGAAGGLGRHIASALGQRGVRLVVSGRHDAPLDKLCEQLGQSGVEAVPVLADLTDLEQTDGLIERSEAAIGPLDLLINNAGMELPSAFPAFTDDELETIVQLNLLAPMILSRHALPGMLARDRGHIVTISSLAGRGGNSYNVAYATTKAGLVGFSRSLRAELRGAAVGASVICPGFISEDGMYVEMQRFGVDAPAALRPVAPERVARAVIDAILHDRPDVHVTYWPMRPLLAVQEIAPRLADRIVVALGADKFFAKLVERTGRSTARISPSLTSSRPSD